MGGIGTDLVSGLNGHLVFGFGGGPDRRLAGAEWVGVGLDVVIMEHTVRTGEFDGRFEELVGAVREVHHDPVGPPLVSRDVPDVAVDRGHPVFDPVSLGVPAEILDRDRVEIDADAVGSAFGRRDDEGTDASEHIEETLAGLDRFDDAVAFGREPRREIHLGDVEFERTAVLAVDGLGVLTDEAVPPPDPEFALDRRGTVDDGPGRQIGRPDRLGDRLGAFVVVLVDDDDLAEAFVGGVEPEDVVRKRLGLAAIERAFDDLELGVDSELERLGIDRRIEREIYLAVLDGDLVIARQRPDFGESLSHRLAVLTGDPDTADRHTEPWATAAVSVTLRCDGRSPSWGPERDAFVHGRPNAGMLTFVGLGLYDEHSITVEGRDAIADADRVFAEFYTSKLAGSTVEELSAYHGAEIQLRDRRGVEEEPEPILETAESGDVVFLTAGDTMISTTHVDLRLRADERGIDTHIVHGTTAGSAAASLTGLQNYRFGKATTLPFPYAHGGDGVPKSVLRTIADNRERGLHTLVYLDIKVGIGPSGRDPDHEEYMTADGAAALFAEELDAIGVAVARAGGQDPIVAADRLPALADRSFGEPLHLLVIPGDLHVIEHDALSQLAGAPEGTLPEPV